MIILSLCIGEIPGEYTNTISETNYENIQNSFTIFWKKASTSSFFSAIYNIKKTSIWCNIITLTIIKTL